MQIERRYTEPGGDPYAGVAFAPRTSKIVNPDGSVVFEMKDVLVPARLVAGRGGHPGAEVLPQGGRARPTLVPVAEDGVPEWLAAVRARARLAGRGGETDARQVFRRLAGCWTYWGWKGGYFSPRRTRRRSTTRSATCWPRQMAAPNSPQWFNTGLHWAYGIERPAAGALLRRSRRRRADALHERLRAPGPARVLHPVRQRRPRQRRRHHGPVGPRGPHLQVRLRHRLELLRPPRRGRAAVRRRQVVRPDELPQDRRPRRRRHQVRRHHAPRRQDGRCSTSTTRTSRSSSTGRWSRSRRSPPSSPGRGMLNGT